MQFKEFLINVREHRRGNKKLDNPEKLATGYTRHKTKTDKTPYAQTNINNINKTCALLQTTGGKDEQYIVFMKKS